LRLDDAGKLFQAGMKNDAAKHAGRGRQGEAGREADRPDQPGRHAG
jgi:hypothetical protein